MKKVILAVKRRRMAPRRDRRRLPQGIQIPRGMAWVGADALLHAPSGRANGSLVASVGTTLGLGAAQAGHPAGKAPCPPAGTGRAAVDRDASVLRMTPAVRPDCGDTATPKECIQ